MQGTCRVLENLSYLGMKSVIPYANRPHEHVPTFTAGDDMKESFTVILCADLMSGSLNKSLLNLFGEIPSAFNHVTLFPFAVACVLCCTAQV